MGILGLKKLISINAPDAIKKVSVKQFSGLRIGFDTSIDVYQLYTIGVKHKILSAEGAPINHIIGTFHRVVKYLSLGIRPVYIFDGKPPALKTSVIEARRELRRVNNTVRVPSSAFDDVKKLLAVMKIDVVQAPSEAEAYAAAMCAAGIISAVASEDTDTLTFGASRLLIGLDGTATMVTSIVLEDVLTGLGITRDQFVDLCILLKCDYTSATLPGIGPKRGLNLIKKHMNIERIIESEGITPPLGFTYVEARNEFRNQVRVDLNTVDTPTGVNTVDMSVGTYSDEDINAIAKHLSGCGISAVRYKAGLTKLQKLNIVTK